MRKVTKNVAGAMNGHQICTESIRMMTLRELGEPGRSNSDGCGLFHNVLRRSRFSFINKTYLQEQDEHNRINDLGRQGRKTDENGHRFCRARSLS